MILIIYFNMLYFVSLPVGQVKPKNNLPEAISACLGQALISNPDFIILVLNSTFSLPMLTKSYFKRLTSMSACSGVNVSPSLQTVCFLNMVTIPKLQEGKYEAYNNVRPWARFPVGSNQRLQN